MPLLKKITEVAYQLQVLKLIFVAVLFQATAGKYQLQQEKAESALQKAQSDFDRLQEKFERAQNDTRRVRTNVPPFFPGSTPFQFF